METEVTPEMVETMKRRYLDMKAKHRKMMQDEETDGSMPFGFFQVWQRIGNRLRKIDPEWMYKNE